VSRFDLRDPGFGLVNFFTLKVLFVDVLISAGDVSSDFAQVNGHPHVNLLSLIWAITPICCSFSGICAHTQFQPGERGKFDLRPDNIGHHLAAGNCGRSSFDIYV